MIYYYDFIKLEDLDIINIDRMKSLSILTLILYIIKCIVNFNFVANNFSVSRPTFKLLLNEDLFINRYILLL